MIQYLLDTNICVFYLRGKLNFNEFSKGQWRESCCISEVTVLELHFGAENSNNPEKHRKAVWAKIDVSSAAKRNRDIYR
jgi:tRNA(fMet)-specific endonuclease VapC